MFRPAVESLVKPTTGLFSGASVGAFDDDKCRSGFLGTSMVPPVGLPIGLEKQEQCTGRRSRIISWHICGTSCWI